jgi:hypothetical protein
MGGNEWKIKNEREIKKTATVKVKGIIKSLPSVRDLIFLYSTQIPVLTM